MTTETTPAFIGLGSNLDDPLLQIHQALEALAQLPDSRLAAVSRLYQSKPLGPAGQPDYINGVARLDTRLGPEVLLDWLQHIESQQGRTRETRWGARTLDLDILLFGDISLRTPRLTLPHPEIARRDFVLVPLMELWPDGALPGGERFDTLLTRCPDNSLQALY